MSLTKRFIDAVHAFDKADKFVIEFAACLGNRQRVLVLLLVAPDVGNGAQGGEQGAGAGQHDAFVETLLEEVRIVLQGEEVGRFDRDEHKDEVQRFDTLKVGVILCSQAFDVGADTGDVVGKLALCFCAGALRIADVGGQRYFGVDDDLFVVGQIDEDVGLEAALGAVCFVADAGSLNDVFAAFLQAGVFQYAFQNHLAPVALGFVLRACQRGGQRFSIVVELGVEGLQAFELVFDGQAFFGFFFISLLNQLAEAVYAFVERIEQLLEMVVVLLGKAAAFLFQNSVGEVLELVAQVLTRICQ